MSRVAAVVFAGLFFLTACALTIVGTALVVVLLGGVDLSRVKLTLAPMHAAEPVAATIPDHPPQRDPLHALPAPPPPTIIRDPQVTPVQHLDPPAEALPLFTGFDDGANPPAKLSFTQPPEGSGDIKINYAVEYADDVDMVVIAEFQADALRGIPKPLEADPQTTSFKANSTSLPSLTITRPGRYKLIAKTQTADASTITAEGILEVKGSGKGDPKAEFLEFSLKSTSYRHQSPVASQWHYLPRKADKLVVKATASARMSLWSTNLQTNEIRELATTSQDTLTVAREILPEPGTYQLQLVDLWSATQRKFELGKLVIGDGQLGLPVLTKGGNHKHGQVTDLSGSEPKLTVFNRYLRLGGYGLPNGGELTFDVYFKNENNTAFVLAGVATGQVTPISNSHWDVSLRFPSAPGLPENAAEARVLTRISSNQQYAYADQIPVIDLDRTVLDSRLVPTVASAGPSTTISNAPVLTNTSAIEVSGTHTINTNLNEHCRVVALNEAGDVVGAGTLNTENKEWKILLKDLKPGESRFKFAYALADTISDSRSESVVISVRTTGPAVVGVEPPNFGTAPGVQELVVRFSPDNPLKKTVADEEKNYILLGSSGTGVFGRQGANRIRPSGAVLDESTNAVKLTFGANTVAPDIYQLRINAHAKGAVDPVFSTVANDLTGEELGIVDTYGNPLAGNDGKAGTDFVFVMSKPETSDDVLKALGEVAGLPDSTGPPVDYPEYTNPREYDAGFNPSDKVITRVARLYYFRDAHRVAQILNRRAKSYNRQNASMSRQLADQARSFAQETVDERREAERKAVEAASQSRQAENSLATLQNSLVQARNDAARLQDAVAAQQETVRTREGRAALAEAELGRLGTPTPETQAQVDRARKERDTAQRDVDAARADLKKVQTELDDATANVTLAEQRINATLSTIEALRDKEVKDREQMDRAQAREDRAVEQQFRLEVAAAKEDPDTYAPGIPDSNDPVAQVSISVIGEGLIQLRGPMKGVNIVRTMINEIDTPVGQVRIGIHTVQINGERAPQMEEIAAQIQRYIDHSRFLTTQSAQMLRNAVVYVASIKAEQILQECPDGSQALRDQKYQDAFFGKDFIDELREMDSEFLHTGNKLLSLHSMDSTSLASALFLLGLASNDTRLEILQVFEAALQGKLPVDEMEYYQASSPGQPWGKALLHPIQTRQQAFQMMADNARFVSFRGFFDHEVIGPNTLNPVQREFIRLAQIFKSRLITEVELKQRIMERALIEERIGNYQESLKEALKKEQLAEAALLEQRGNQRKQQVVVLKVVQDVAAWASAYDVASSELRELIANNLNESLLKKTAIELALEILDPKNKATNSQQFQNYQANAMALDSALAEANTTVTREILDAHFQKVATTILDAVKQGDFVTPYRSIFGMQVQIQRAIEGNTYSYEKDVLPLETAEIGVPTSGGKRLRFYFTKCSGSHPETAASEVKLIESPGDEGDSEKGKTELKGYLLSVIRQAQHGLEKAEKLRLSDERDTQLLKAMQKLAAELEVECQSIESSSTPFTTYIRAYYLAFKVSEVLLATAREAQAIRRQIEEVHYLLSGDDPDVNAAHMKWAVLRGKMQEIGQGEAANLLAGYITRMDAAFDGLLQANILVEFAEADAERARRPLDHKKFLDMLIDETEEKFIELVEGTRAHTAVIDDYVKRLSTALEDDFNTQFYEPAFRRVREQTYSCWGVDLGQIEHTTVLTNNRDFAKVLPQATMEFDLPKRDTVLNEALSAAYAAYSDYGALVADPNFLALTKMYSGQPTSSPFVTDGPTPFVRDILPGLPSQTDESLLIQAQTGQPELASQLEALIPDPSIYKFETGTGYEIRPVIQPDGQSVVFQFNYMYTTNVREPVRADEKHLGRVKRHYINTDVQIGNYELREVSRYRVALKASRTGRGVPLLEDIPVAGALFRPLPQAQSSLQQNIILANTVIYPTLFDLMGLRWAPAIADLDALQLQEDEFVFRKRMQLLKDDVYDYSSFQVDQFLRIPEGERRPDLYRPQNEIPSVHPNGYNGPGLNRFDSPLQEGYSPAPSAGGLIEGPVPNGIPAPGEFHFESGTGYELPELPGTVRLQSPNVHGPRRNGPAATGEPPAELAPHPVQWGPTRGQPAPMSIPAPATLDPDPGITPQPTSRTFDPHNPPPPGVEPSTHQNRNNPPQLLAPPLRTSQADPRQDVRIMPNAAGPPSRSSNIQRVSGVDGQSAEPAQTLRESEPGFLKRLSPFRGRSGTAPARDARSATPFSGVRP